MNLINVTGFKAGYVTAYDASAREYAVVIVKATYLIPKYEQEEAKLAPEQVGITPAEIFTGEPGFSAALYESDYCRLKPRCDVLLNGSAYAPRGQPAERVSVSVGIGGWKKALDVIGKRTWRGGVLGLAASSIERFTVQPISYDVAFGGTDKTNPDPAKHRTYLLNHVGVGYHENMNAQAIVGQPMPNTEEIGKPINNPKGSYKPMSFGVVGRAWQPRIKWAGTYDQHWLDEVCPLMPADFDDRYNQSAAEDQQIDYLLGGEKVELTNLTLAGRTVFRVPKFEMPVVFLTKDATRRDCVAPCDTIFIEPDLGRFMLVWRTCHPLRKNLHEMDRAVVGPISPAYFRALELGKEYYPSIAAYVASRKEES